MQHWNKESVASGLEVIAAFRGELLLELTRMLNEFHRWDKSEHYYDIIKSPAVTEKNQRIGIRTMPE